MTDIAPVLILCPPAIALCVIAARIFALTAALNKLKNGGIACHLK